MVKGIGCSEDDVFNKYVEVRDRRLGRTPRRRPQGDDPLVRTELHALRAQVSMLMTYVLGIDHRLAAVLGEHEPAEDPEPRAGDDS